MTELLNSKNHAVESVAAGHEVQVLCRNQNPTDPDAKRTVGINNMTYKVEGRVTHCPLCGDALDADESRLSDQEREMLDRIRDGDAEALNGGFYVTKGFRDVAERLVEKGEVVRFSNPAGVSPTYVPVDSDNYSDERLERMSERQEGRV